MDSPYNPDNIEAGDIVYLDRTAHGQVSTGEGFWRDRRLEQQHALNLQLFRDGRMDKLKRGLRPLAWGQAIQMLIGVLGYNWVQMDSRLARIEHIMEAGCAALR